MPMKKYASKIHPTLCRFLLLYSSLSSFRRLIVRANWHRVRELVIGRNDRLPDTSFAILNKIPYLLNKVFCSKFYFRKTALTATRTADAATVCKVIL